MSAREVGEHDPMVFEGGSMLGVWVECECGWISPSYYTETNALKAHEKHAERRHREGVLRPEGHPHGHLGSGDVQRLPRGRTSRQAGEVMSDTLFEMREFAPPKPAHAKGCRYCHEDENGEWTSRELHDRTHLPLTCGICGETAPNRLLFEMTHGVTLGGSWSRPPVTCASGSGGGSDLTGLHSRPKGGRPGMSIPLTRL